MKKKHRIFCFVLLIVFLSTFMINNSIVYAEGIDDDTILIEITGEDRLNDICERISIRTEKGEPFKNIIKSFDVNENGMVAILHPSVFGRNNICIFSSDGIFQKAFSFKNEGEAAIKWQGDNLQVFCLRGDVAFTFDMDANILEVHEIIDGTAWNEYYNNELSANEKAVGDVTYSLDSNIRESLVSHLRMNSDGGTIEIYNDGGMMFIFAISVLTFIVVFFFLVLVTAYKSMKKR